MWKCYNLMQENMLMMMQEYGPNTDTVVMSSTTRTPMSVLERKFTKSEMISESSTTSSIVEQSDKEKNKRRRVNNGLCRGNGSGTTDNSYGFRTSQFRHC